MTVVLGAGAFGTALALTLAAKGPVTLWGRDIGWRGTRENPRLPGVTLPDAVSLTDTLPDMPGPVLLALPMQVLGGFLRAHATALDGRALVLCCKGIDLETLRGPSALVAQTCPAATVAVLTGPSFAADIARGLPTALTLACDDDAAGASLQAALSTPTLRLYRTTDVTGAELGGALKNVVAIGAGIVMGAGLGDSARAALMTRGYAEMVRFATRMGARAETLAGLSGFGDLVLTCTSAQSRNFAHGFALGAGQAPAAATVEGLATAQAVMRQATRFALAAQMPVTQMVAAVTTGRASVAQAVQTLMTRPLKEE
jgi:glycerol-3-phosphate dehydrogenase (NAD(P)+)